MERYHEVMVALSESVIKYRMRRPLSEKIRRRHIQLAIKLRYLGNHASQIKRLYGSLSRSHGRSFRNRREKVCAALPGGGLTMTSYPVGNTTSLSLKPCLAAKKLLWITIMKSCMLRHFYKNKTANINTKNL